MSQQVAHALDGGTTVLYLLTPTGLRWTDMPGKTTIDAAREHGADLGQLDWQPAEEVTVAELLPVALRYGVPCSGGIALSGTDAVPVTQPRRIQETHAAAAAAQAKIAKTSEAIDQMLGAPGATQELNQRVDEQHEENLREAQEEAQQHLDAREVDSTLLDHWRSLGGTPPLT